MCATVASTAFGGHASGKTDFANWPVCTEIIFRQSQKKNLTETVRNFEQYLPEFIVLPHPSPRSNIWIKKNPWFADHLIP
ncbi:MAG: uracil-DNA glycosylase [Granulosicoccus sp.]|jgi:uracil-DNA glycosylase